MADEDDSWPLWLVLTALGIALVAAGCAIYFLPVWMIPILGDDPESRTAAVTERNGLRTAAAALVVGIGSLGALYFTARNSTLAVRTLAITQRGNVSERYSKAIEYIGSDSTDITLGGIYSLEQISIESDRDRQTVVEILSAFVRRRVPSSLEVADDSPVPDIPIEAQAALTVLGRLPASRSSASRADLTNCRLDRVVLRGAHLENADLTGARFYNADLRGANLLGCEFVDTRFQGADLQDSILSSVERPISGAVGDFDGCELSGAGFVGAELYRASFKNSILGDTDFSQAKLGFSSFENASMTGLNAVNITKAQLDGFDSAKTRVRGPMIVRGADLREAKGLHQDNLNKIIGDRNVLLTAPLYRPESWR